MPGDAAHASDAAVCCLTDVTAMKQAQERLVEVANRDDLTGLAGLALAASRLMLRTSSSTGGGDA